jgi:hypothetical protein
VRRRPDGGVDLEREGANQQRNSAIAGFVALHQRYDARLRLLVSDSHYWRQLRPRAPLIDWML